ncbi:MAG: hypothetical protein ACD_10C00727G0007 [uncultured bacterium]|nr:MAG: hypothetical protein ACD_10C00727G0007 [uncultured bacterium]
MAQEQIGVGAIIRVERDANAGRNLGNLIAQQVGLASAMNDPVNDLETLIEILQFVDQEDKLIAAETGQCICLAQLVAHALGEVDQQLIAGGMTQGVVDALETVEIEHADGKLVLVPLGESD